LKLRSTLGGITPKGNYLANKSLSLAWLPVKPFIVLS